MKKRVPGFRGFAVKTVLMLAALSVTTLSLRASIEMDALLEVLIKRTVSSQDYVLVNETGNIDWERASESAVIPLNQIEEDISPRKPLPVRTNSTVPYYAN